MSEVKHFIQMWNEAAAKDKFAIIVCIAWMAIILTGIAALILSYF